MSGILAKNSIEIQELMSILLSTLDESTFFNELSKFLNQSVSCDRIIVHKVLDDQSTQLIACNGSVVVDGKRLDKGEVLQDMSSEQKNRISQIMFLVIHCSPMNQKTVCKQSFVFQLSPTHQ